MRLRVAAVLFALIALIAFGVGIFWLMYSDGTPIPGLILVILSAAGLFLSKRFSRHISTGTELEDDEEEVFRATDRAHKGYQYDVEQRRRDGLD